MCDVTSLKHLQKYRGVANYQFSPIAKGEFCGLNRDDMSKKNPELERVIREFTMEKPLIIGGSLYPTRMLVKAGDVQEPMKRYMKRCVRLFGK